MSISPDQPPRPQKDAPKIPGDHTADVGDLLPLEHVEHGLARRPLGLPVVRVAHRPLPQQVAPAVVPGVVVPLFHLLDAGTGLLLALHTPDMADEAGALLDQLRLTGLGGDVILCHGVTCLCTFWGILAGRA